MYLKIISWNIRHFRKSKVDDFIHTLWEVCSWADVVFIYEDHSGMGEVFAKAMNDYEAMYKKPAGKWKGMQTYARDEYVAAIWKGTFSVSANSGAQSTLASLMSGERYPAVFDISANGVARTVTVAAWHAYGPAKVAAKDLFQRIMTCDCCDVLIGDFNFQTFNKGLPTGGLVIDDDHFEMTGSIDFETAPSTGLTALQHMGRRSSRLHNNVVMQEIVASNHTGSTTYTDTAQGKRTTGLDRCLVRTQHVASVQMQVAKPVWHDEMFALTDHVALQLIMEVV